MQYKLNKHVTTLDYIDKISIILSATSSGESFISFTSIIGAPVGIASASLTLIFSLTTGIVKNLLNKTRNKKKKHEILILAKSKLNSTEILLSQELIDLDISHDEFIRIFNEKDKYENIKENLRTENKEYKITRLSSIKSKTKKIKSKNIFFFLVKFKSEILLGILYY